MFPSIMNFSEKLLGNSEWLVTQKSDPLDVSFGASDLFSEYMIIILSGFPLAALKASNNLQ